MRGDIPAAQFTSFSNSSDTLSSTSAYMTATLLHSFQAPRCHTGHSERWHLGENGPGQEADTPAVQFTSFSIFSHTLPSIFTHQRHEWMSVIQVIQKWHPKGNVLGTIQFLRGFPPPVFLPYTPWNTPDNISTSTIRQWLKQYNMSAAHHI